MIPQLSRDRLAVLAALIAPLAIAAVLVPFRTHFANTDAALILVLVVVAVAANGLRVAGILAALSAALWFDFFLTRPYEHLAITARADLETSVLLLAVGIGVTELAVWGRRQHTVASQRAGYLAGISDAAAAVASGRSPSILIDDVSTQLTSLLALRECHFEYGVAGVGGPLRLGHDGQVTRGRENWDIERAGLPEDCEVELLVQNGDLLRGRFLFRPAAGSRPSLAQRLVAVALADQVGAALGAQVRQGRS
jgi:K+-sensing histidine kinase KdpD